jgi:MAP/microtubule affinity-regulating kinase
MVDEIAWGVGWGTEGDDATHGESDDDLELSAPSTSQSRSRSRPAELSIPDMSDWQQEEPRSRPALDAASRRSSSRAKRSQSRAPIVTSSARASNRSMSRHSRAPSPSHISISTSILVSNLSSSTSSPFSSSPSSAVERGRRPNKSHTFTSRSPSPSMAPTTPADIESLFHPPTVLEQPDELDLDSPRDNGRGLRSIRRDLYSAVHQREDTRDVPSDWSAELGKKSIPEDQESLSSNGHDETNHHVCRSARPSRNSSLAPSRRKRPASAQPPWARDQEKVIAAPLVQKHSVESFLNHFRGSPASGRANRGRSMDRE